MPVAKGLSEYEFVRRATNNRRSHATGIAMMKRLLLCAPVLLAGCAIGLPTDYQGPDAGHAVIGIGATTDTHYNSYSLLFRRIDSPAPRGSLHDTGWLSYYESMISLQKRDYDDAQEAGVVVTADLPPGRYELFDFSAFNHGGVDTYYRSPWPFSIPFTIEPGKTVYLGNYQANGPHSRNVQGLPLHADLTFVVEDRQARDMAVARAHPGGASLPSSVEDATPVVASIGNPRFVSRGAVDASPSPAASAAN
jgi:hypothetical protein